MTSARPSPDIVQTYQGSGLHGNQFQYIRKAYGVALYRERNRMDRTLHFEKNNHSSHAEKKMIQHLEEVLESETLRSQTITLYVNFSPCFECSADITEFLERADQYYDIDLKLDIIFAHLYKIRRPSCLNGSHLRQHRLPDSSAHDRNLRGLRKLSEWDGVSLRPFGESDWRNLSTALQSPGPFSSGKYRSSGRKKEDENLLRDLEDLDL